MRRNCCDSHESPLLKRGAMTQTLAQNLWSPQQSVYFKKLSEPFCLPSCTVFNHAIFKHLSFILTRGPCNYSMCTRRKFTLQHIINPTDIYHANNLSLAADAELLGAYVPWSWTGQRLQHQPHHIKEVVGKCFKLLMFAIFLVQNKILKRGIHLAHTSYPSKSSKLYKFLKCKSFSKCLHSCGHWSQFLMTVFCHALVCWAFYCREQFISVNALCTKWKRRWVSSDMARKPQFIDI